MVQLGRVAGLDVQTPLVQRREIEGLGIDDGDGADGVWAARFERIASDRLALRLLTREAGWKYDQGTVTDRSTFRRSAGSSRST